MQKEYQLAVDIEKKILTPSFEVNTLDLKTIKLKITITKGMTLVDLTDIAVRMSIRKPDGNVLFQDCQVINAKGGQVEITLENQAYIMPGSYSAEIMCFKGTDKVAVTGSFSYRSIRGIMDDKAVESKSEFTAITKQLDNVQATMDDLRENGTGIDAQARQEVQEVSARLVDIATNVQNQEQLEMVCNSKENLTINIGKPISISSNLTISSNIRLMFNNEGKFIIESGSTLTIEGEIVAGYFQIFDFVDNTSVLTTTKYKGEIKVDWFGADPNISFSYDYTTANGTPTGKDSSLAFKKCMSFAQDARYFVLNYAPNGRYFVTDDNPCGIQKNVNLSYRFTIEGNHAKIFWKPSKVSDSLFGKLGLMYFSNIRNFDVITLGEPGDRKGTIFNTKLGFNNIHYFSKCNFDTININAGNSIGCDKVFNFEPDGTHSHDDLSEFKNIHASNYNIFVNLLNNEAVKNTFYNCYTIAYTDNAKTFNIVAPAFSGYISITDHHFIAFNHGEIMLYTPEQYNAYPIYLEKPRLEVRGEVLFAFCDIGSMDVYINGLSFVLGGGVYNYDNNYFIIGQQARITFDRCMGIYGNIKLKERTNMAILTDAVISKQSGYIIKLHPTAPITQIGYPNLRYDNYANRTEAIKAGKIYKRVKIEEPNSTNDTYNLPVVYNSTGKTEYLNVELTKFKGGKTSIAGSFNTPSDIIIESLFLSVSSFDASNIDAIEVGVYKASGGFVKSYVVSLSPTDKTTQELLPVGKFLTLPHHSTIAITWKKSGITVADELLFPQSNLRIKYKSIMTSYEANNGQGAEKMLL